MKFNKFVLALAFLGFASSGSVCFGQGPAQNMETMALMPGCEDLSPEFQANCNNEKLWQFIVSNLVYPAKAVEEKIQGTVIVQYVINAEGEVEKIQVIQSVHQLLDDEAMRIIKLLPKHSPAKLHGRNTTMTFNVPMEFRLFEEGNQ